MNQILDLPKQNNSNKNFFKIQFVISIILLAGTICIYAYNTNIRNSKENLSQKITNNYNISRLYSNEANSSSKNKEKQYTQDGLTFTIIGMIEIPKIKIYYPIISESTDELLKIAPCRVSGPLPNENGNLCIAGHNYDNYKFFSKLSSLDKKDKIIIHDINGNKLAYFIFEIYEVLASDTSPLSQTPNTEKKITLITCDNFSAENRLIIKAVPKNN